MARAKTTNTEKLLRRMKKVGGMTRKEMVKFLLKLNGKGAKSYGDNSSDRGLYSALIYGTNKREGILERFCTTTADGVHRVTRTIKAPFTAARPGAWLDDCVDN